jgi:hypothetical protein
VKFLLGLNIFKGQTRGQLFLAWPSLSLKAGQAKIWLAELEGRADAKKPRQENTAKNT